MEETVEHSGLLFPQVVRAMARQQSLEIPGRHSHDVNELEVVLLACSMPVLVHSGDTQNEDQAPEKSPALPFLYFALVMKIS